MKHGHEFFSNKLILMLGKALVHLLNDSRASLKDLLFACELRGHEEAREPEYHVVWLARHGHGEVVKLIEAIHEEVTTPNPAVLTKSTTTTIPGYQRVTYITPQSYIRLIRQLEIEGFTFSGYRLVPIDSEAPQEYQDKTELATRVRSHPELDPTTLIHHMDESDSTLGNEDWNSAAGAARQFFEGLVINISVCAAQSREGVPLILPEKAQRPKFGQARTDLLRDSCTKAEEDKLIGALYGFQSEEGGHYGITDEQMAKLTRRFCWVLAAHLLTKYESLGGTAE